MSLFRSFKRIILFILLLLLHSYGNEGFSAGSYSSGKEEIEVGKTYFITATSLFVRSEGGRALGSIARNDSVKVLSLDGEEGRVQIKVIKTWSKIKWSRKYFVSYKFLSTKKITFKEFKGKYFVVQNLATEKIRVYEKNCNSKKVCNHNMVLESSMAIGEDKKGTRTNVGSYRISQWIKFYQDGKGRYPSWYRKGEIMPPPPHKSPRWWMRGKYNFTENGVMRGAFGWYAAKILPNHNYQWMHGTIGWGSDKDYYIRVTRSFISNLFSDPRSSGCSRVSNEVIAWLREHLEDGTPIIKIYAKEVLLDVTREKYTKFTDRWNYILTTKRKQKSGEEAVLGSQTPPSEYLERGVFELDTYPNLVYFKDSFELTKDQRQKGESGNTYAVSGSDMHGVFYVDAGLVENYKHPRSLKVGGFKDESVLPIMKLSSRNDKTFFSKIDPEL